MDKTVESEFLQKLFRENNELRSKYSALQREVRLSFIRDMFLNGNQKKLTLIFEIWYHYF